MTRLESEIARIAPYAAADERGRYQGEVAADAEKPTDGESYDKAGNIRPVPPGVENTPEILD